MFRNERKLNPGPLPDLTNSDLAHQELQMKRRGSTDSAQNNISKNALKKNLNILCIDDDEMILELIEAQLNDFEPNLIKCTSAAQAKEALTSSDTKPNFIPDLILCDIMMPETVGYQFHEFIKSDNNLIKIPFVYVTALYSDREYRQGMLQGADGYLAKPFTKHELVQEIQHVLQRHEELAEISQQDSAYIKLLGGQNVRVNGVLEPAPDRGAEQVVYYLILQGREVNIKRSDVMTALWESISQSGFRSVLSRAKRWSEAWANWTIDRNSISFSLKEHSSCDLYLLEDLLDGLKGKVPDAIIDAKSVRAYIDPEDVKEIANLYQGELLPSFPEAWAGSRRTYLAEAVKTIYIDALDKTILPRRYARAIKRIIDIDPDDFDLWEEYIKTLKNAGMEQEAQRAARQLEQQQS